MHISNVLVASVLSVSLMSATFPEKSITMYTSEGKKRPVHESEVELYKAKGWYENIEDVTVSMYDPDGKLKTVYLSDAPEKLEKGFKYAKSDTTQLMFADDGRIMYVPLAQVDAYLNVGWYKGGTELDVTRPMVAITYDDGPAKYTDSILDCLEKYNVRATFFVQGKNVSAYPDAVARAVALGCEIGNHTQSHANLPKLTSQQVAEQLSATNNAVYAAAGIYPKLFRPPYGAYNTSVLNAANMPAIMWSVDTLDWKTRSAYKTLESVRTSARDGSIILMHDIHEPTADACESVIKCLLKQGYQLVTVSELLDARKGGAEAGKAYGNGY